MVHYLFYIRLYDFSPIRTVAYTLSLLHYFYHSFFHRLYFSLIPNGFRHIWIHLKFNKQSKELTLRGRCCCSLPTPRRPLEFRPLPSRCSSLTISRLNTNKSEARARIYILKPLPVNQSFYPANRSMFTGSTDWPFDSFVFKVCYTLQYQLVFY
jgi:hypothetical protein